MLNAILSKLLPPRLSKEAFDAYFYRLPERISVEWQRDGKMIVGRVSDGKQDFVTQGRDAENFVEMVNDAVYAVYGIPRAYIRVLRQVRSFSPDQQGRQKLADASVRQSSFPAVRNERTLTLKRA